jgi:hypothetical protein
MLGKANKYTVIATEMWKIAQVAPLVVAVTLPANVRAHNLFVVRPVEFKSINTSDADDRPLISFLRQVYVKPYFYK